MSEYSIGPFSANEVDRVVQTLQGANIQFTLFRDKTVENQKIKNNMNAILRTEFRTDVFLDQSYYIRTSIANRAEVDGLIGRMLVSPHVIDNPRELQELTPEEVAEEERWRFQKQERQRVRQSRVRWVVLGIVFGFVGRYVYMMIVELFSK